MTLREIQSVTLLAGLRPQQPLSVLGAELDPLGRTARNARQATPFRNLSIRRHDLMYHLGMRRNVFAKSLQQKRVDNLGLLMRYLFVPKTLVELQRMARRAALHERWGRHVTLAHSGTQVVARARGECRRIRR